MQIETRKEQSMRACAVPTQDCSERHGNNVSGTDTDQNTDKQVDEATTTLPDTVQAGGAKSMASAQEVVSGTGSRSASELPVTTSVPRAFHPA